MRLINFYTFLWFLEYLTVFIRRSKFCILMSIYYCQFVLLLILLNMKT